MTGPAVSQRPPPGPAVLLGAASIDVCRGPYNAVPGQDCTTALQNAINDGIVKYPRGFEIYFSKPGTYPVNGPQQTATLTGPGWSYTYSGQILFPATPMANECSIRIRGAVPANTNNDADTHPNGTILQSNATSGNVFDMIPVDTQYKARNGIRPEFVDISVQCPTDPQCGGIRCMLALRFSSKNLNIYASYNAVTGPTGSGIGLTTGWAGNSGDTEIEAQITGFPVGLAISEHAVLKKVYLGRCGVAIRGIGAAHVNKFVAVDVEECITVFQALNPGGQPDGGAGGMVIEGLLDGENVVSDAYAQGPLVDEWIPGAISGTLNFNLGGGWAGGFPLKGGSGSGLDMVNLSKTTDGGYPGWRGRHPSDNFVRVGASATSFVNASPGTTWPTLHPWKLTAGGFDLSAGQLKRHAGATATAALPCLRGGISRTVQMALNYSAGWIQLFVQNVLDANGNLNNSYVRLEGFGTALTLRVYIGGAVTTSIALPALAAGAHTLAVRLLNDATGVPSSATAYTDGVAVARHVFTPAERTGLTPPSNAQYPYARDVVSLLDDTTYLTSFVVRDAAPDSPFANSGTAPLIGGTTSPNLTLTTNSTTAVTGISPALPVGAQYAVTSAAAGIAANTIMTVTGSGTTGTLATAATATAAGAAATTVLANSQITANSIIRYFRTTAGGTLGELAYTLTPGVGFTIVSNNAADTSTIYYEIVSY